ncbi:MAG: FAD-dependent oxidoreductase [Pseudomonadota bacterium]
MSSAETADVIVVGGGMFGSSIAYGLARSGADVVLLDEGDVALRAARGNFGLVWVQSKGQGMQPYADWSRESSHLWDDFAVELQELTGIDVDYRNAGGLQLLLGEEEVEKKRSDIAKMRQQAGPARYDCDIITRAEAQEMLPNVRVGDAVSGASFCPHDGHVNPLLLLRALHMAVRASGGRYHTERHVETISREGDVFVAHTAKGRYTAPKIVLGAGHGAPRLGPMVGLDVPIRPERGQVLITERLKPLFRMAVSHVRQTTEGTIQIGSSAEDTEFDDGTTIEVIRRMAGRAVQMFPFLETVRLNRAWGCIRVLTPDMAAIYDESVSHPGAFVATSHSGVTLAAINVRHVAHWIATGEMQPGFERFSARRFDVQAAA